MTSRMKNFTSAKPTILEQDKRSTKKPRIYMKRTGGVFIGSPSSVASPPPFSCRLPLFESTSVGVSTRVRLRSAPLLHPAFGEARPNAQLFPKFRPLELSFSPLLLFNPSLRFNSDAERALSLTDSRLLWIPSQGIHQSF